MIKYPTASERDAHIGELEATLDRVRALHGECNARCGLCHQCGALHPCATLRALNGEKEGPAQP